MDRQLHREILEYLAGHNTLTLATTTGETPWAAALYYVNRDFNLYFLSNPKSRHCRNLAQNPRIAAAIQEDYKDWHQIKGIQLEGRAIPVSGPGERASAMALYLKKYPFVRDFPATSDLRRALSATKLYKVIPAIVSFVDNSGGYFHRREITL